MEFPGQRIYACNFDSFYLVVLCRGTSSHPNTCVSLCFPNSFTNSIFQALDFCQCNRWQIGMFLDYEWPWVPFHVFNNCFISFSVNSAYLCLFSDWVASCFFSSLSGDVYIFVYDENLKRWGVSHQSSIFVCWIRYCWKLTWTSM